MKKLKNISLYKYIIFLLIILISIYRANIQLISKYNINDNYFIRTIIDYNYKDKYITFNIKGKELIKCNYYLKENEIIKLNYGDKIYLKGTLIEPTNNTIPNTFNYKKYLNNNNIKYILEVDSLDKIIRTNNIFYKLKNTIKKRINKIDTTGYINAFILGNKNDIDNNIYNTYKTNGILHIFSVSGMHISILSSIILLILNKIKKNKNNIIIVILFLIFYLILTNYQPSIVRSIIFFILLKIFNLLKININTKDTLLIAITLILITYPKYIYNIGFLYSSIISYTLIYYSNYFNKNYLTNIFLISLISFLVSLPITINNNYSINILSIFINLIFVPLISFILYPLSLLTFIFPILNNIFELFINLTEYLSTLFSKINIFNISIPKLNILTIIIYYILLYLSLSKNKKYFLKLIIFILIIKNINKIDTAYYVYYIDVGQGDMSLIKYKDEAILIDTGNNINNYYIDNVLIFFKSIGVNNIDSIIISHGDSDHIGNTEYLIDNIKVNKVILNNDTFNELENDLIKYLNKKNIKYYNNIQYLNIKNNKLYFLNTIKYDNENDNSNINYLKLNKFNFLFMGDAGIEVEEDLKELYNLKNIDVLKVGHHGSKTSSSEEFIGEINPKYSIISVGKNNRYGHPNKEVLDNLKNTKIYRTDQDGSIMFKIKNTQLKIETCRP